MVFRFFWKIKGIVRRHEGVGWVESESGKGTQFPEIFKPVFAQDNFERVLEPGNEMLLIVGDEQMIYGYESDDFHIRGR